MLRVEDQLKGQLLPGSKVIPDTAVWLTLQTVTEMSEEGDSDQIKQNDKAWPRLWG